jgi:hypothetical protein
MTMAKQNGALPADLAKAKDRFDIWRQDRKLGTRIPQRLWTLAAKLAQRHGVCRTASVLGLDYYSLKERVQTKTPASPPANEFVEVSAAAIEPPSQCLIDLEDADGAKMTVRLSGAGTPDLVTLVRSFRKGE